MKQTLARELEANGYTLLHHYRDKRAQGTRHKIVVGFTFERFRQLDQTLVPTVVSEIVHKYVPEAEAYGSTPTRMEFVWLEPSGAEPKSVGTDYYSKRRAASKALARMGFKQ